MSSIILFACSYLDDDDYIDGSGHESDDNSNEIDSEDNFLDLIDPRISPR